MDTIPAATLVLLRDTPLGFELLMVERATSMGFAAGAMVFPGGKVDPADRALAHDAALAPGFAALDPLDAAARVAAIRETFEEVGVLVATGPPVAENTRLDWRRRLIAHETDFAATLSALGQQLDATLLLPFAHWCPPAAIERKRFDTRFYLARLPAGETALHDGSESLSSHWLTPHDALARADAGTARVIFPTRRNLERLAAHAATEALLAHAAETPVHLVEPWTEEREGALHLCIRGDCGYPVTSEPLARALRG